MLLTPARYAVLEFETLLDSSSIDSKGWAEIAQTIFRNYKLFDGFVVLHGTDSLAYTCSALSFMLQNLGKPVIVTGTSTTTLQVNFFGRFASYMLHHGDRWSTQVASKWSERVLDSGGPVQINIYQDKVSDGPS
jgi:hypothetical protein